MRVRFKNENETTDSNSTIAGPAFSLPPSNDSLPEFPFSGSTPPVEDEITTEESEQQVNMRCC